MVKRLILIFLVGLAVFLTAVSAQDTSQQFAQSLSGPTVNTKLLQDRRYMRVEGGANVYDAPNGNVVRSLNPGFVFLTTKRDKGGWSEINAGEYVRTKEMTNVNGHVSQFAGVFIPGGLPFPIGWALQSTWTVTAPGIEAVKNVGTRIKKYERLNLYATADVDGKRWYQVGPDQWVSQFLVGKVQPLTETPGGVDSNLWMGVDLYEQVLTVYEGTSPIFATLISSGLARFQTREGLFHIYYRAGREDMTWGEVGDDYYLLEEVPWTMFFDGPNALHGEYWHDGLGYRRSHGCVNLSITDANWLFNKVAEYMGAGANPAATGPAVYIYSTGEYNR